MNKRVITGVVALAMCVAPVFSLAETAKQQTNATQQGQAQKATASSVQRYEVLILGDKDQEGENYVKELQRLLKHYNFFDEEPTGYYGEKTQKSVMDFQKKHGTTVDGKAGPVTRKILFGQSYEPIPSTRKITNTGAATVGEYSLGDRGPEIVKIQERLTKLNYYTYARTTEYYGPITEEAVLEFKKTNGLDVSTSKIDNKTYNALFSENAKKKAQDTTNKATTAKTTSKKTTSAKKAEKPANGSKNTKPTSNAGSSKAEQIVNAAMAQIGDKYVYGASGPNSFDCSGLIIYALRQAGKSGPRSSAAQSKHSAWQTISKNQLKRGDLVFFSSPGNSNVGHAGIYIGGGQFVHASSGSKKAVMVSSLASGNYATRFRTAKRVV